MKRESLVEELKECQRKNQSIGIWHTLDGIPHFTSGRIETVNIAGVKLGGSYFIYFEGDRTTIEKILSQGRVIYKREDKKTKKKKKKPPYINHSHLPLTKNFGSG